MVARSKLYLRMFREVLDARAHVDAWRAHVAHERARQRFADLLEYHGGDRTLAVLAARKRSRRGEADAIVAEVAEQHGYKPSDLFGRSREVPIALARHIAVFRVMRETKFTLSDTGRHFGRHHTTIMHSVDVVRRRVANGNIPLGLTLQRAAE